MSAPGTAGRPPVLVIAEAGVNHGGDVEVARRLIDAAAAAGAGAVKFQTFSAERLARRDAPKARYQEVTVGPEGGQLEMLRRLELSADAHRALADHARARAIEFMSTPFDEDSADLLETLGVRRFKIGSGEITNLPLLRHVGRKARPVILSTGMATLDEIGAGLDALRAAGAPEVTLLHCVSDYPTDPRDVNLAVMATLRRRFGVPVGFSDHTTGIAVPVAAVALGACVLEKHLTLDRTLPGPDHRASLEPAAFAAMVAGVREVETALGDGDKRLTREEEAMRVVARRGLVLAQDLPAGTVLEPHHLAAKRPATGISPMDVDRVVGRRLARAGARDTPLVWDLLA